MAKKNPVNDKLVADLKGLLQFAKYNISYELPSDWAERCMNISIGAKQGRLQYSYSPYLREIIDFFSPFNEKKRMVLMSSSKIGKTTAMIEPAICYLISQFPCRMGFVLANAHLMGDAMAKLDLAIENCNIRSLIKAHTTTKKRNAATGDTLLSKQFAGGSLIAMNASNHKTFRQHDWKVIIVDDIEAAKTKSKESGDTVAMIEHRGASYRHGGLKIAYVSSPELAEKSIIEPLYLKGDQRRYYVPCPLCGTFQYLEFSINSDFKEHRKKCLPNEAGLHWKLDNRGVVIDSSVGYVCRHCAGFFKESKKIDIIRDGVSYWEATALPEDSETISYHINSIYSSPGMVNWVDLVKEYVGCWESEEDFRRDKMKTFLNQSLGLTFKEDMKEVSGHSLMQNCRNYEYGIVPEALSIADGNGLIVLLTLAADVGGRMTGYKDNASHDDVRVDWELLAHSETGATYSVAHGSIGTFIYRDDPNNVRTRYSLNMAEEHHVWIEFEDLITRGWAVNSHDSGITMKVGIAGIDLGAFPHHIYYFLDNNNVNYYDDSSKRVNIIYGLRGKGEDKYLRSDDNTNNLRVYDSRTDCYQFMVHKYKDKLADYTKLVSEGGFQPPNFMNYPRPDHVLGMYTYEKYFSHYEAEHRVAKEDGSYRWEKKSAAHQNHFYDCRIYNLALKNIYFHSIREELYREGVIKNKQDYTWADFVLHIKMAIGKI